jgi:hypothetical protein
MRERWPPRAELAGGLAQSREVTSEIADHYASSIPGDGAAVGKRLRGAANQGVRAK